MRFSDRRSKMENGRWQGCFDPSSILHPR